MLFRIFNLIRRCFKALVGYFPDAKKFGFKTAFYMWKEFVFPGRKNKNYINAVAKYVDKFLEPLTEKYKAGEWEKNPVKKHDFAGKTPIFVCWWQGEEKMPPIVKACYERLKSKIPETAVLCLLTEDNYTSYVDLPKIVIEKYNNKNITLVHLTDILRYALARTYGGMWIDSTVFLTDGFEFDFLQKPYYTQRFKSAEDCPGEACMGKWCNFFFCGQTNNMLFSYVYDALIYWWEKHDRLIDYVLVDYLIRAAYFNLQNVKATIDEIPPNNENMWNMIRRLNEPYDEQQFASLTASCGFFKLSYQGNLIERLADGRKTVYAHIIGK